MAKRKRANKLKWWQIVLRIFGGILGFIFCFYCFSGIVNAFVNTSRNKYAKSFEAVKYESRPELVKEDGYYTFRTDGEFKINLDDPIMKSSVVVADGKITDSRFV